MLKIIVDRVFQFNERLAIVQIPNPILKFGVSTIILSPMRFISLFLALLAINCSVFAESERDSLIDAIDGYLEDEERMVALLTLSELYYGISPDSVAIYGKSALDMAQRLRNKNIQACASHSIGRSFDERGIFDSSLHYFVKANNLFEELNDSVWVVSSYSSIGNTYYYKGNHRTAIKYHSQSLKLAEEWNLKPQAANAHNNLAIIYSEQKFYDRALEHYQAAKRHFLTEKDSYTIGAVELNIGNIYAATGRPDSAIYYFLQADSLFQPTGQLYALALNWTNLGEAYQSKNDIATSEYFFNKAIEAQIELEDEFGLAYSYARLAVVLIDKDEYDQAHKLLDEAIKIGNKIGALRIKQMANEGFHDLHYAQGNWKAALDYKELYILYRDSIQNEETGRIISNLESEFVTQRKENEIIRLKSEQALGAAELRKRNIQLITSIIIALLLLVLVFVVGYFMRALRKANTTLSHQKQMIEKINQHMTDGIRSAERLQKGAFPDPFIHMPKPDLRLLIYRPKDIVSGDFYWSHKISDTQNLIAVADCTGHGVSGALLSMLAFLSLERSVSEFGLNSPDSILHKTNDLMKAVFSHETHSTNASPVRDGMDISICLIDSETNTLSYSGAKGMALVMKAKEKEIIALKGDRFSIGDDTRLSPDQVSLTQLALEKGDKVIMYSDGIIDQFGGPRDRKFSHKRLKELVKDHIDSPITELADYLGEQLDEWQGSTSQTDDITVLGFGI